MTPPQGGSGHVQGDGIVVLVLDDDGYAAVALVSALEVERDLAPRRAASLRELTSPDVDVVLLVGDLGSGRGEASVVAATRDPDGPPWVVLTRAEGPQTDGAVDAVLAAGAHGCLVESSTPLQIVAAVRAAARGDAALAEATTVTGPLVQRVRREQPPLTEREVAVLRLVQAGLGNQEIAERLYLSVSSVKSHLSHTYGRLGVSHRDAAVAEARRQGLL